MSKFKLIPFDSMTAPNIELTAELNSNEECLFVSFRINKGAPLVDFGASTPNKSRVIKLWEKTCFEIFIKNQKDQYIEFNFSPCFEWNCFYFNQKGDALTEFEKMIRPNTDILLSSEDFFIVCEIRKEFFPLGFFDQAETQLSVGLTSVIKDKSGINSYWALAHADTRPNFHHFDSFKYKF